MKPVSIKVSDEANKAALEVKKKLGISVQNFASEAIFEKIKRLSKKDREKLNPTN